MGKLELSKVIIEVENACKDYSHFEVQFTNDERAYKRALNKLIKRLRVNEIEEFINYPVDRQMSGANYLLSFPRKSNLIYILKNERAYYVVHAKKDKRSHRSKIIYENIFGERALIE